VQRVVGMGAHPGIIVVLAAFASLRRGRHAFASRGKGRAGGSTGQSHGKIRGARQACRRCCGRGGTDLPAANPGWTRPPFRS
jgi:hypothetical protein